MFDHIPGNERIKQQLTRALLRQEFPPAFLFYGPKGAGKSRFAKAFIKALFPENLHLIENNSHPDVQEFSPDNQGFSMENIRTFCAKLSLAPFLGKRKVAVFYQAERLSILSQNALLKTLEEPPNYALMLFITEDRSSLIPTVLSRMTPLLLQKMEEKEVLSYLKEKYILPEKEMLRALRLAEGSLGLAEKILEKTEPLLPLVLELLLSKDYLSYRSVVEKIAVLEDLDTDLLFSYIYAWHRDRFTAPGYFLVEELPREAPLFSFAEVEKVLFSLQSALSLHMKLEDALETLFFEVLESSRPA